MNARNKAMLNGPAEIAGKTLQPLTPMTYNLLATAGLLKAIASEDGYDPNEDGFEPLWHVVYLHSDPGRASIMIRNGELDEVKAEAAAWGETWTWQEINDATRWLADQAEMIGSSMVVAQPGKANRVRKVSRRTR